MPSWLDYYVKVVKKADVDLCTHCLIGFQEKLNASAIWSTCLSAFTVSQIGKISIYALPDLKSSGLLSWPSSHGLRRLDVAGVSLISLVRRKPLSKQRRKLTRGEAVAVAQAARKLPEGVVSDRVHLQLNPATSAQLRKQNPAERGATYALGKAFEAKGYLLIYDILDRLGVRIISTIIGNPLTIVCRHKTYEGDNQAELLLEILRDRLENFNPGGFHDEPRITD